MLHVSTFSHSESRIHVPFKSFRYFSIKKTLDTLGSKVLLVYIS